MLARAGKRKPKIETGYSLKRVFAEEINNLK